MAHISVRGPPPEKRKTRVSVRNAFAVAVGGLLAGCGTASVSSANPTAVPRPSQPPGWVSLTSSDGHVQLVAPPDMSAIDIEPGVFVQTGTPNADGQIQIWAIGPRDVGDQPRPDEALSDWLERSPWLPGGDVVTKTDEREGSLSLPSGMAYRVAFTDGVGTPFASRVDAFVIATAGGYGVMQIVGHPEAVAARAEELDMVALLLAFK